MYSFFFLYHIAIDRRSISIIIAHTRQYLLSKCSRISYTRRRCQAVVEPSWPAAAAIAFSWYRRPETLTGSGTVRLWAHPTGTTRAGGWSPGPPTTPRSAIAGAGWAP